MDTNCIDSKIDYRPFGVESPVLDPGYGSEKSDSFCENSTESSDSEGDYNLYSPSHFPVEFPREQFYADGSCEYYIKSRKSAIDYNSKNSLLNRSESPQCTQPNHEILVNNCSDPCGELRGYYVEPYEECNKPSSNELHNYRLLQNSHNETHAYHNRLKEPAMSLSPPASYGITLDFEYLKRIFPFLEEAKPINVNLTKDTRGLGISVTGGIECDHLPFPGLIRIKKIHPQTSAWLCGQLNVNDFLIEVNGIQLTGLTSHEALEVLRSVKNEVNLKLCRPPTGVLNEEENDLEIELRKQSGSLGFTLQKNDNSILGHTIRSLVRDPALSDGRIQPGDKLLSVNGTDLCGWSHERTVRFLRKSPDVVRIRIYRDAIQTPVTPGSPINPQYRKPLRKEARDMISYLAMQNQSMSDSDNTLKRRRKLKNQLSKEKLWDSLVDNIDMESQNTEAFDPLESCAQLSKEEITMDFVENFEFSNKKLDNLGENSRESFENAENSTDFFDNYEHKDLLSISSCKKFQTSTNLSKNKPILSTKGCSQTPPTFNNENLDLKNQRSFSSGSSISNSQPKLKRPSFLDLNNENSFRKHSYNASNFDRNIINSTKKCSYSPTLSDKNTYSFSPVLYKKLNSVDSTLSQTTLTEDNNSSYDSYTISSCGEDCIENSRNIETNSENFPNFKDNSENSRNLESHSENLRNFEGENEIFEEELNRDVDEANFKEYEAFHHSDNSISFRIDVSTKVPYQNVEWKNYSNFNEYEYSLSYYQEKNLKSLNQNEHPKTTNQNETPKSFNQNFDDPLRNGKKYYEYLKNNLKGSQSDYSFDKGASNQIDSPDKKNLIKWKGFIFGSSRKNSEKCKN